LERRQEIARVLKVTINDLSRRLRAMTEDERRAVFYRYADLLGEFAGGPPQVVVFSTTWLWQ
jgi:hypothetical protein